MNFYTNKIKLDDDSIKKAVDEVTEKYLNTLGKSAMQENKFRIAFEELLLQFRDCYGENAESDIVCSISRKKCRITLSLKGARQDFAPFDENLSFSYDILDKLGISPRYVYSRGNNKVIWDIQPAKTRNSMMISMLFAIFFAVIVGIIMKVVPTSVNETFTKELLNPFFNKTIAIISEIATPLVFFAVIDGIVGIGDIKSFGKIGSKVLQGMLISYVFAMTIFTVICVLLFGVSTGTATGDASALGQTVKLVLDIIPDNLVAPFSIDNDLQVISISIFVGVALLVLGDRVPRILALIKELTMLINKMMSLCCSLLPLIVFLGVTNLICSSSTAQLMNIGKMMILFIVAALLFVAVHIIRCAVVTKEPLKNIIPKQMSTFLINITTSSQVAALPENMKCCKEGFGVDEKLTDFALPLGVVMYMPCGSIFYGVVAWTLCMGFGIPITISVAIKVFLISIILAIAAPPIPGSALVTLPIFFASCAIPNEAMPIALVFGTIAGYTLPALNGFLLQLELLMSATKLDKVDKSKLHAKLNKE